ncbi:cyclopropane-fatty-acyl-phospholipid synthase family protein [soil metagenome]
MTLKGMTVNAAERLPLPDSITRAGIGWLVGTTRRNIALRSDAEQDEAAFVRDMVRHPIAAHADKANAQHYELPPEFFALALGPRRKYSCCWYQTPQDTLAQAEVNAIERTVANADLHDGQRVLELGCGWGSLSLFMAERYPASSITAVSNSRPQREHIMAEAKARGLSNLQVITADMNDFSTDGRFDRVVSVEMFEHMSNWTALLARVRDWLADDGRLFLHVFTHRSTPYRFDHGDDADWIAQHFFTGGIMPSHGMLAHFHDFQIEADWRWSGEHYARTAEHWLLNFDREIDAIKRVLHHTYGAQASLWQRRWRLFFLATSGLFGHAGGDEWGVSHYRLRKAPLTPSRR